MAKQYSGSVDREQVMKACESLGLKPKDVFSINLTGNQVSVIEFQRDEEGHMIYNKILKTYEKRAYTLSING